MQLPDVEHMSSAEKNWFATSIAGMIVADGRADQTELEFLKEAINSVSYTHLRAHETLR